MIQSLGREPQDRLVVTAEAPPPADDVEREIRRLLDGSRTLEQVLGAATAPLTRVQRVLQRLKVLGHLAVTGEPPQPAARPLEPLPPPGATRTPLPRRVGEPLSAEQRQAIEGEGARIRGANHYDILAVPPTADPKEIQRAYFMLARQFHPDVFFGKELGDVEGTLREVTHRHFDAYSVLRDTHGRRREYDAALGPAATPEVGARSASDSMKDDAARQFEKGLAYFQRNDYVSARPFVELACAFDPDNAVYREHRDRIRRMLGTES